MKSSTVYGAVVGALVGAGAVGLATTTFGEPPKEAPKPGMPAMPDEKQMQAMMEAIGKPGEQHKEIAKYAGTWHGKVTFVDHMTGQEKASEGKMVSTLVLDGRFLRQEWSGEYEGQPFKGIGYWGFDNLKKEYVGLWMDTMGTGYVSFTGSFDDAKKVYTATGMCDMGPMGEMSMREVMTVKDDTHHTFEMFMGPKGQEAKVMTIEYTKK